MKFSERAHHHQCKMINEISEESNCSFWNLNNQLHFSAICQKCQYENIIMSGLRRPPHHLWDRLCDQPRLWDGRLLLQLQVHHKIRPCQGKPSFRMLWILSLEYLQVLIAGLLGNLIRFLYISFITWPWLVLPFEFLQGKKINGSALPFLWVPSRSPSIHMFHNHQHGRAPLWWQLRWHEDIGITHAAVWAACCSFISHNTDAELRPSAQGVLQVTCLQWRASPCPLECLLPCSNVFDC